MADTQRSIADLLALLADNCNGEITPQVMRDLVLSLNLAAGFMWVDTPAETPTAQAGTYYKAAGSTTLAYGQVFTHTDNRLTYTGAEPIQAFVIATTGLSIASGSNDLVGIQIAKNDGLIAHSEVRRLINSSPDVGGVGCMATVELDTNDYIELWIANHTQAVNTIVQFMQMLIIGRTK